ncbi:MAG: hypothetical protein MI975_14390 [Cytophagales bacterium]|nr:hypothetical protein [Cytophagales bacterium]
MIFSLPEGGLGFGDAFGWHEFIFNNREDMQFDPTSSLVETDDGSNNPFGDYVVPFSKRQERQVR